MKCPICKDDMIILELEKVEIDYCIECKGIWLDACELELIYRNSGLSSLEEVFKEIPHSKELNIKCPVCRKKMEKVEFNKTGIILDKCRNDHGYWFDKGELELLLESNLNDNSEIIGLLRNIFSQ